jgi:hypothetical protein
MSNLPQDQLCNDRELIKDFFDSQKFIPCLISEPMTSFRNRLIRGNGVYAHGSMHFCRTNPEDGWSYKISIIWTQGEDNKEACVVGSFYLENADLESSWSVVVCPYQDFRNIVISSGREGMDSYLRQLRENFLFAPLPETPYSKPKITVSACELH